MSDLNITVPSSVFTGVNTDSPIEDKKMQDVVKAIDEAQVINYSENKKKTEEVPLSSTEVTETIDEMNAFLQEMQRNLSFSMDEKSGQSVIIVKDSETEEVIRQIPSEELVVLRKKMDDLTGILFDTKV